jgi:eukaryotic-like serine/threonine-protein kinase
MPTEPNQVKSIFMAAAEKSETEREEYLSKACAGDQGLRQRVEQCLQTLDRASGVKTDPAELQSDELTLPPEQSGSPPGISKMPKIKSFQVVGSECPGARFGPYKLLKQLGEGGMGTVWMAEQTEPVKRVIALKLIKPGMDSNQVVARFEAERQAIALMDHPNIAKVLDAGTTETGRPFFAMELVKGSPITKFCDDQKLTLRQRLELFVQVCQGIQHAHQKGIIHRDIKPSNVIVASYDGKAVPKVIDFGVAKASGQKLTDRTMFTGFGAIVGTMEYMSPEQAEPNQLDIDTRSDIYALGIMLYELLTGTTPLSHKRATQASFAEVLRLIREEDPPRPSTRLSQSKDGLAAVAAQRKMDPAKLSKLVRGELDWLVMKALDKDRNRRYETANAFAMDVQRYLHDEPVLASPPSPVYRLRKFAKRNKGKLVAAAAVLVALVGGMVGTTLGLLEAQQQRDEADVARDKEAAERATAVAQRDRAKRAEADALAVLAFFRDNVFAAALPKDQDEGLGLGIDATIRDAVDAAEPRVAGAFQDHPLTEAHIRNVLGIVYMNLGQYDPSVRQHERALELRKAKLGTDHLDTLQSMNNLALAYRNTGRKKDALPILEATLKARKAKLGPDDPATLTSCNNLALAFQDAGRLQEALPLFKETLELRMLKLGPGHRDTFTSMNNLALAYRAAGRLGDALPLYEETLKLQKAKLSPEHPDTLTSMFNLANAYGAAKRLDEAVPLFEETVKLRKAVLGPYNQATLDSMKGLATAYNAAGRQNDSLAVVEEMVELHKANAGPDDPKTVNSMNILANDYQAAGRLPDAERLLREVAVASKKLNGPDSLDHATQITLLGLNLLAQRKYGEAEAVLRDILAIRKKRQADEWTTFNSMSVLGGCLLAQKNYADAEPLLLQGYEGMKMRVAQMPPQGQPRLTEALERVVQLYEASGQQEQAAKWRQEKENTKQKQKKAK